MGLIITATGLCIVLIGMGGYAFRLVRETETVLPDHDTKPAGAEASPTEAMESSLASD